MCVGREQERPVWAAWDPDVGGRGLRAPVRHALPGGVGKGGGQRGAPVLWDRARADAAGAWQPRPLAVLQHLGAERKLRRYDGRRRQLLPLLDARRPSSRTRADSRRATTTPARSSPAPQSWAQTATTRRPSSPTAAASRRATAVITDASWYSRRATTTPARSSPAPLSWAQTATTRRPSSPTAAASRRATAVVTDVSWRSRRATTSRLDDVAGWRHQLLVSLDARWPSPGWRHGPTPRDYVTNCWRF